MGHRILVLMGPTGTGKSALALELAQLMPAVIINADAMQMVRELSIITARPTEADMVRAEHALYGVLPATEPTSVARWLEMVKSVIEQAWAEKKMPMLVGGTGMYIQALMEGLAKVPAIPDAVRESVRAMDSESRLMLLRQKDPEMASRLKPGDTQRIARALEVVGATGVSLAAWQAQRSQPLFPRVQYQCFALEMERAALYNRLNQRFSAMMAAGALEEVKALEKLNLAADVPILRAHGVPELLAFSRGEMALDEAILKAQQNTRNYAKRQMTWLRNQMPDIAKISIENQSIESPAQKIMAQLQK